MLSVIFCSRVKDNPDSNIQRLLDSAVRYTRPEERTQLEFLIKYDADDDAKYYEGEGKAGRYLVTVDTTGRADDPYSVFTRHGGYDRANAPR